MRTHPMARAKADAIINACEKEIASTTQIQVARGIVSTFKKRRASELYAIVAPSAEPTPPTVDSYDPPVTPPMHPVEVRTLTFDQVGIPTDYKGRTLSSEEEVRQFTRALTRRLIEHVQNNEKIIL